MSSQPHLPVSASPTCLNECFFFNSLVVGLPYSLIFLAVVVIFVFKFLLVLLLAVRGEKLCMYLRLHLGRKCLYLFFKITPRSGLSKSNSD